MGSARLRPWLGSGSTAATSPHPEPPTPAWRRFLVQFHDPLTILLLVAPVVSFVAWIFERETPIPYEAIVILAIVILNGVLGFVQENRAEQAVAALQAMAAPTARVLRDERPQDVPAGEIVPGDVLLLEERLFVINSSRADDPVELDGDIAQQSGADAEWR